MTLTNVAPQPASRMKSTIDTILLTTLLNREMNADGRVFTVNVSYVPSNQTWQASVDCFRGTFTQIHPEQVAKQKEAELFIKKLAEQLRLVMLPKPAAGMKDAKPEPAGEKK